MPTFVNTQLLDLVPGQIENVGASVVHNFIMNPTFTALPNWPMVQFQLWYPALINPLANRVVNLAIDFNALPILQAYTPTLYAGSRGMDDAMTWFIRNYLTPYWVQSPSGHLVAADPRGVNVDFLLVPDARLVGNAITYVLQYLTPPGTPSGRELESAPHNVTLAGNSTGVVASKLKLTNSTVHLDANLTKRATDSCLDFYPNLLPFIQSGPITEVGTNSLSCAS